MTQRNTYIAGQKFGMLTTVRFAYREGSNYKWEFLCDCGELFIKQVGRVKYDASIGGTPNCGCQTSRLISESSKIKTHGMWKHPACHAWNSLKRRCLNESDHKWNDYGGRGISVCEKWLDSFDNFWSDMGGTWRNGLSIDRIDNNGNYEPSNCRWATPKEQQNNRRCTIIVSTTNGDMCVAEAAKFAGINYNTMLNRVKQGWDKDSLFKKSQKKKHSALTIT